MKITDTNLIQKATETKTLAKKSPATRMQEVLSLSGSQNLLREVLAENKEAFVASLIDLYGSDSALQDCDPAAVLKEALKAVSINLPISKALGFSYVIPYRNRNGQQVPQFQIGYRGYVQLAYRTKLLTKLNNGRVYEGELKSNDKLTGDIDLRGERTSDKVIGYFAYFETVFGLGKGIYMTVEEVQNHVNRYSKSFKAGSSIWKDNFHEMAEKTVLRRLLTKWAPLSVDPASEQLRKAFELDDESEPLPVDGTIDQDTGEIAAAQGAVVV